MFDEVIDEILLDFVNSKLELYKKLSNPLAVVTRGSIYSMNYNK